MDTKTFTKNMGKMCTKQSLTKILLPTTSTIFVIALLFACSPVFAQVKIGTAPATIGVNSNLEVEAVNNKKIIADKTTGTLKVENKPSALATDSLVTRDVNGELHQMSQSRLLDQQNIPVMVFSGTLGSSYIIPIFTAHDQLNQRILLTPRPGYAAGWNATTKRFTLPSDGFYQVEVGLACLGTVAGGGIHQVTRIWSTAEGGGPLLVGTSSITTGAADWQSVVWSGQWTAGSTVSLNGFTLSDPSVTGTTGNCVKGYMSITKVR